jgi:hypothetical protein
VNQSIYVYTCCWPVACCLAVADDLNLTLPLACSLACGVLLPRLAASRRRRSVAAASPGRLRLRCACGTAARLLPPRLRPPGEGRRLLCPPCRWPAGPGRAANPSWSRCRSPACARRDSRTPRPSPPSRDRWGESKKKG